VSWSRCAKPDRFATQCFAAKRVAGLDVADDGAVVFSDGRDIIMRTGGDTKNVLDERFVSHVVAVPKQML
jgi:hypothetical protein